MFHRRISRNLVFTAGLVVAMGALGASQSWADQARSRSSVSKSPQSRGADSGRTAVNRGGGGRSRGGASSTRSGGGVERNRYRGHGRYDRNRGHRHNGYRLGLGFYGRYGSFYGGYGGYYYSPFFYGYPVYYPYHPARYGDFGALDLNVRPKKSEVWVDGQYVGTAGRFDGYPGHLWLGDGRHELIFFKQGFETERREVTVLEGVTLDIVHYMVPGESVPAEELTVFSQEPLRPLESTYREPTRALGEPPAPREPGGEARRPDRRTVRKDTREEPGWLKLDVAPADASIYLDGRFLGSGQELVRLHSGLMVAPGKHTLEVVRPGFDSQEVPFRVESGEETALTIDLEEARV